MVDILDWSKKIQCFLLCLAIAFLLTQCPKNKSDQKSLVYLCICMYLG